MNRMLLCFLSIIFSVFVSGQDNDILLRNFRFYHREEFLYKEMTAIIYNTLTEEVKSSEFMTKLRFVEN